MVSPEFFFGNTVMKAFRDMAVAFDTSKEEVHSGKVPQVFKEILLQKKASWYDLCNRLYTELFDKHQFVVRHAPGDYQALVKKLEADLLKGTSGQSKQASISIISITT